MKRVIISLLTYLVLSISIGYSENTSIAITPSLENIEKLQEIAKLSNGGALGCGIGTYYYISSDGQRKEIKSGLDAIHVFGREIHFETLDIFVKAKASGKINNERNFSDLFYVILSIYAETKDPGSIDEILKLTLDKNETISRWAKIAVVEILKENSKLKEKILKFCNANDIKLPKGMNE